ncbi:MAG: ATP-binding protein [Pyrinomonadaceae bacterium]
MNQNRNEETRQILGRVSREEFVGRTAELQSLVTHATLTTGAGATTQVRGLVILLSPLAGVSELLRQAYDELFNQRAGVVPIYFSLRQTETTAVSAAIEFVNTFLLQYIAYRRNEPSLCKASLTLNDLAELAPAADLPWIEDLIEGYHRQRLTNDDREFVRFCLTVPRRVPPNNSRPFVFFNAEQLATYADASVLFASELVRALTLSDLPYALAGLRREIIDLLERSGDYSGQFDVIRLEPLGQEDARNVVSTTARRLQVAITDQTRELLVQQLEGIPFFITAILQGAREKHLSLNSYLDCERLCVDELIGGRLHRYFTSVLERIVPEPETRASLIRLLSESAAAGSRTLSFEAWSKRLNLTSREVEKLLRALHLQEIVNWDGETVDVEDGWTAWKDFVRSRFRLDALREPRALVVADLMSASLRRAPQAIAFHYRRAASLRLREFLAGFNSQLVPRALFDYEQFANLYKGATPEEVAAGLDSDTNLVRLPQVFHTATGLSFSPELRQFGEESCVVAHAFERGTYTDANEIVWLVAKIDSKLEAPREPTGTWLDRLESLARKSGFLRTQFWLIANEGFSLDASELLRDRGAYGSSQLQFELLTTRLSDGAGQTLASEEGNDIVLIIPMGSDYEVLAATTVEQLARRINFPNEAINHIKTAVVEACINASEHSLSPDRKIYQRFRVESDKLVITVASRGIVPSNIGSISGNLEAENGEQSGLGEEGSAAEQRRGWGIKLIKTLMDEVEFEHVDEGTSLRMTKYLRS